MPNLMLLILLASQPISATKLPADQFFKADGVKLHYLVEGQGVPVVLIHGLRVSAMGSWHITGVMGALAPSYRVIALDLPGHGQSDKPETDEPYGAQMAEDVRLLLDHLKIKQAHIVGSSLGGMVALKFVAMHPDRAVSVVLGSMGWLAEGSHSQKQWQSVTAGESRRPPVACLRGIARLAVSEKDLKAIRVPVVVIIGENDPLKQLYVQPLQQVRKDWPVIDVKGAAHADCINKPQFRAEIKKWLDEHPPR